MVPPIPGEDHCEQPENALVHDQDLPHPSDVSDGVDQTRCEPVAYWAATGLWSPNFHSMAQDLSASPNKRDRSYTQTTKDGETPRAHTRAFEAHLMQHGIVMNEPKGMAFVSKASKELCAKLLLLVYEEFQFTQFPLSKFLEVLDRVRVRNEYRLFKDITPLLVPSPELLYMSGHEDLEHAVEEVSADWLRTGTMGGPKPRPDLSFGIGHTAFTEEEIAKLRNHTAWEKATLFTDNMYFPFLLCEAKCSDQGINKADRQNAQSSSMAVNAIIQLHRVLGMESVSPLSGQILVFSLSHDNERIKIYGHFAVIKGSKEVYYRYPVESFTLNFRNGEGQKRASDFVQGLYHEFYPMHLTRIRDALAKMDDPQAQSLISDPSVEDAEPARVEYGALSTDEARISKNQTSPKARRRKMKSSR